MNLYWQGFKLVLIKDLYERIRSVETKRYNLPSPSTACPNQTKEVREDDKRTEEVWNEKDTTFKELLTYPRLTVGLIQAVTEGITKEKTAIRRKQKIKDC